MYQKHKRFTDELGEAFPEFLRLRELAELCAAYKLIRSVHDSVKARHGGQELDERDAEAAIPFDAPHG